MERMKIFIEPGNDKDYRADLLLSLPRHDLQMLLQAMCVMVMNVTLPHSSGYLDPQVSAEGDYQKFSNIHERFFQCLLTQPEVAGPHGAINSWWSCVRFLADVAQAHNGGLYLNDLTKVNIKDALLYAAAWKQTSVAADQAIMGEDWGSASGWTTWDPAESVRGEGWMDSTEWRKFIQEEHRKREVARQLKRQDDHQYSSGFKPADEVVVNAVGHPFEGERGLILAIHDSGRVELRMKSNLAGANPFTEVMVQDLVHADVYDRSA